MGAGIALGALAALGLAALALGGDAKADEAAADGFDAVQGKTYEIKFLVPPGPVDGMGAIKLAGFEPLAFAQPLGLTTFQGAPFGAFLVQARRTGPTGRVVLGKAFAGIIMTAARDVESGKRTVGPGGDDPATGQLDRGIPADKALAVATMLETETDPGKLRSFAASLRPDFPIAAGMLEAKASQLEAASRPPGLPPGIPAPVAPPAPAPPPGPPVPPAVIPPVTPAPPVAPAPPPHQPSSAPIVMVVSTHDAGPAGDLKVRSKPVVDGTDANMIGRVPRGGLVQVTGPATDSGFFPVLVFPPAALTKARGALAVPLVGFASKQFLAPPPAPGAPGPLPPPVAPPAPPPFTPAVAPVGTPARVVTSDPPPAGNLRVRSAPASADNVIGSFAKNAIVMITGPQIGTFVPVTGQDVATGQPISGFSGASFLVPVAPTVTAGRAPNVDPRELEEACNRAALALDAALQTGTCRSYNEPIVKRFQALAKACGKHDGGVDGFYDTRTQASLSKFVGAPAPPCFKTPTGGPSNPDSYWSPVGA